MKTAELLDKIRRMDRVQEVTLLTAREEKYLEAPVDVTTEVYVWVVKAVWYDKTSARTERRTATHESLELALADIIVQIEFPQYPGGWLFK